MEHEAAGMYRMARTRRPADESRARLIEAAAEIIRDEGYPALTAQRLGEKVGLKRQIVHYYFRTMDELLLAVVRHYGEAGLKRFDEAARSHDPLQVIWEIHEDSSATNFAFMAMANHRPVIRAELRRYMDQFRKIEAEAVGRYFAARGIRTKIPPVAAAVIVQSISRVLAAEANLGATRGHAETKRVVTGWLRTIGRAAGPTIGPGETPTARRGRARIR